MTTPPAAELICMECLGPATLVFFSQGIQVATLCEQCWEAEKKLGEAVNEMLEKAIRVMAEVMDDENSAD